MEDCLFCRIAAGQIRVERLAETDELFSFPDIQPMAPVLPMNIQFFLPTACARSVRSVRLLSIGMFPSVVKRQSASQFLKPYLIAPVTGDLGRSPHNCSLSQACR